MQKSNPEHAQRTHNKQQPRNRKAQRCPPKSVSRLPPRGTVLQVAAVAHLHSLGFAHRDVAQAAGAHTRSHTAVLFWTQETTWEPGVR